MPSLPQPRLIRDRARRAGRMILRPRASLRLARVRLRRSLLARVVATTIVLGLLVVLLVGQYILQRISDGLVESRAAAVQSDAKIELKSVQDNFQNNPFHDFPDFVNDEIDTLAGPADKPSKEVIWLHAKTETAPAPIQDRAYPDTELDSGAIPMDLRNQVNSDPTRIYSQLLTLPLRMDDGSSTTRQAIAVGGMLNFRPVYGGHYELYFIYPLDSEVAILDNVRRTLIAGGAALVALVGAVAWMVTRQVVAPVRQAARTAEQLASGRLDRRMRVRGDDDLARLARAFNEMASSLERQIHQLEELSRVQRRFVSDVSHELRTPLTTIRMAGEVMYEARESFDPAVSRSAELLQNQLDRFESLLGDLLEVSRFDAGAAQLEIETSDVREAVHRVVDGLRPLAERRGVTLTVRAPDPAVAEFDPRRIERVVRNLVGNAIEHGEGRPVLIRVVGDADAVAVGVRDHGVGLRATEQRLVFNRFWRADPARARSTGGTGLGLAIALEDAHLHGGWLQVWGAPGLGANFRLTLPRRAGVVLAGSPLPLVPADAPTSARTGAPEPHPVAMVVAAGGTQVVASDGAASVLTEDAAGVRSLPPVRAESDEPEPSRAAEPDGDEPGRRPPRAGDGPAVHSARTPG